MIRGRGLRKGLLAASASNVKVRVEASKIATAVMAACCRWRQRRLPRRRRPKRRRRKPRRSSGRRWSAPGSRCNNLLKVLHCNHRTSSRLCSKGRESSSMPTGGGGCQAEGGGGEEGGSGAGGC